MSPERPFVILVLALVPWFPSHGEPTDADVAAEWMEQFACPVLPRAPRQDEVFTAEREKYPGDWNIPLSLSGERERVVRGSLPFPVGMSRGEDIVVYLDDHPIDADIRVLTRHPDEIGSIRRALITFRYSPGAFPDTPSKIRFIPERSPAKNARLLPETPVRQQGEFTGELGRYRLDFTRSGVRVFQDGELAWEASPFSPGSFENAPVWTEVIEKGRWYLWVRQFQWNKSWPRILEARLDILGNAVLIARLQKRENEDGYCPAFGWTIRLSQAKAPVSQERHDFTDGTPWCLPVGNLNVSFPVAHRYRKGIVSVGPGEGHNGIQMTYYRSTGEDRVPLQPFAWRAATVALGPDVATLDNLLEDSSPFRPDPAQWRQVYPDVDQKTWSPELETVRAFHREWIASATLEGDDFGNVTSMPRPAAFGMNRLNHDVPIFEEYYRSGDLRLKRVALLWCDNMHDLSIWWGNQPERHFGGTRYNNVTTQNGQHRDDKTFMWRSNDAVTFCTKGYDAFFLAWEETGDPRMAVALLSQAAYATQAIRADTGECRNIGDALDFTRLYEYTGYRPWLEKALELFQQLREKLGPDHLFSQGGEPILPDETFIDTDAVGTRYPFAKPYILGYALAGLPRLLRYYPDEPRLVDTVRAVALFMARTVDPAGGWRYPHPKSSRVMIAQGMEHAAQLVRAAEALRTRGENIEPLLDAIETVLRARVQSVSRKHTIVNLLNRWEEAAGIIPTNGDLHSLYHRPEDRDPSRDYADGLIVADTSPPEGVVYFSEVLDYYAGLRDPANLSGGELPRPLWQVLERLPDPREPRSSVP
ncbi:MAG TPA: hypothetical protein PK379_07955 [Candidatus Hydrogenedentes bacterium]|nr:hypothetical protein [Candidatus Hydrogenedentota bacterium]HOJ67173.1 hypothetical protein [Candidatus Hydrogenedentota bacterium]HOK89947.1 hypothetical protein [Candidatus Hydrogenedentota bacterium]